MDKYNTSLIILQEISTILSLFVVVLTLLGPTANQITNPSSLKVFTFVLVSNFFFEGFIKDCTIAGAGRNEKFRTLHNDKIVADLLHAMFTSVMYII